MLPRVSVIIPTFNAAKIIETTLASVAAQNFEPLEVILVDDRSVDDTVSRAGVMLERYGLAHRILHTERNSGPAAARNLGVAAARGEYVAFVDADDEWLPGKLAAQTRILDTYPTVTLCGCQATWVDAEGRPVARLFENLADLLPDGWKTLLWNCYVVTSCAMVRRDDIGIRPFDTTLPAGEDRDLWIKLASNGTVALVQDVMVRIRLPTMSRSRAAKIADTRPMLRRHLAAFADSLSPRDQARALGSLDSEIGRILCRTPRSYGRGASYLVKAALRGFRPRDNLRELVRTARTPHQVPERVNEPLPADRPVEHD